VTILHLVLGVIFFVIVILFALLKVYVVMIANTPISYDDEDKELPFLTGMVKEVFAKNFWQKLKETFLYSISKERFKYIKNNLFKPFDDTIKEASVFEVTVRFGTLAIVLALAIVGQKESGLSLLIFFIGVLFVFLGLVAKIYPLNKEVKDGTILETVLLLLGMILQVIAYNMW